MKPLNVRKIKRFSPRWHGYGLCGAGVPYLCDFGGRQLVVNLSMFYLTKFDLEAL